MALGHRRKLVLCALIGGGLFGLSAPSIVAAQPIDAEAMVVGNTTTFGDSSIYWSPGHHVIGVDRHGYFEGRWSVKANRICYSATWHQSPVPKSSTSSQGGGFIATHAVNRCVSDQDAKGANIRKGNQIQTAFDRLKDQATK